MALLLLQQMELYIFSQTSKSEGSRITIKCDDGFRPSLAMDGECQPDGNWQPDPAGVVCTAETSP